MKFEAYYFGCWQETGHYLWSPEFFHRYFEGHPDLADHFPMNPNGLDGYLLPPSKRYHAEGLAFVSHVNGWTVVTFNDNSVDRRPGSHSAFIIKGVMSFEDAMLKARSAFPEIFKGLKSEVRKADETGVA